MYKLSGYLIVEKLKKNGQVVTAPNFFDKIHSNQMSFKAIWSQLEESYKVDCGSVLCIRYLYWYKRFLRILD